MQSLLDMHGCSNFIYIYTFMNGSYASSCYVWIPGREWGGRKVTID